MRHPLRPGTILAVGTAVPALALALVPDPAGPWTGLLAGAAFGLVFFGGIAWAARPGAAIPGRRLLHAERLGRVVGLLGSAGWLACVRLECGGPVLAASACAAFGGFFVAVLASLRQDARSSSPIPDSAFPDSK